MAGTLGAFAIPGAVVWAAVGGLFGVIPFPSKELTVAVAAVAALYGAAEAIGSRLRSPEAAWQVPKHWVAQRSVAVRTLVWGATLGPGLMTRNPYASIWFIPAFLAISPSGVRTAVLVGAAAGAVHGAARAAGILLNVTVLRTNVHLAMLRILVWRTFDGFYVLFMSGLLAGAVVR